jgi:hypothetical protein
MPFIKKIQRFLGIAPKLKKMHFDPEKMSVEDIHLPHSLTKVGVYGERDTIKDEMHKFKSLDYVHKDSSFLTVEGYSSLEVGTLLKFIKENRVYIPDHLDQIIPPIIMKSTLNQLHIKVFDVVIRFNDLIDPKIKLEELENDIRWSPLEVGYLLLYLTLEDRTITHKKKY